MSDSVVVQWAVSWEEWGFDPFRTHDAPQWIARVASRTCEQSARATYRALAAKDGAAFMGKTASEIRALRLIQRTIITTDWAEVGV